MRAQSSPRNPRAAPRRADADAPANSSVIWGNKLVVSTDVGIFATSYSGPGNWVRLGSGQPAAPSVDLAVSPDQGYLPVATHGQGLWKLG